MLKMQIPPKHHKIHQAHINPSKTPRFLDISHDFPISFTPFSQGDHLWGQSCFNLRHLSGLRGLAHPRRQRNAAAVSGETAAGGRQVKLRRMDHWGMVVESNSFAKNPVESYTPVMLDSWKILVGGCFFPFWSWEFDHPNWLRYILRNTRSSSYVSYIIPSGYLT